MGRATPIPTKTRRLVEERSGFLCEGCGEREATELHHRKYRSRGGGHEVSNLIHLCGWGNHTGCHGTAHSAEGHELGWSVNSWSDPALTPVLWRGGMAWLTPDGRVEPAGFEPSF
ncbi:HNH endonuclease [Microbacterium sp. NPDC055455]